MKSLDGLKREQSEKRNIEHEKTKRSPSPKSTHKEEIFSELFTKPWRSDQDILTSEPLSHRRKNTGFVLFKRKARRISPWFGRFFSEKAAMRTLVTLIVVCAVTIPLLIATDKAKSAINEQSADLESDIYLATSAMDQGKTDEALVHLEKAYRDISALKLLVQRYGQDISYLRFSPLEKSKLTADESVLDATFAVLDSTAKFQSKLSEIMSGSNNSDNPLLLNLAGGREKLSLYMAELKSNLRKSSAELASASKYQDDSTKAKLLFADNQIEKLLANFSLYEKLINDDLAWFLGENGQNRKILIIFQNNSELRGASGGSLGSFAVANFSNGEMKSIDFGRNIFKIDQAFEFSNYIAPPDEIKFLRGTKSWTLKDSGWSVDGVDASAKIMEFYKRETGEDVDGTLMIDTTAVSSLLKVTGPIEMTSYGKTISSDNFREELQKETHEDYWTRSGSATTNEPKQIISDMIPIFIPKVLSGLSDKAQSLQVISSLKLSIKRKDITLSVKNDPFQDRLNLLNLSAKIDNSIGDYLYVTNSNIDGGKSSLSLDETLNLATTISDSGEVNNQLDLVRTYPSTDVKNNATNTNFVRLLIADGSTVSNFNPVSGDFQQYHDAGYKNGQKYWLEDIFGKKMINFWITTKPGATSSASIKYLSGYKLATGNDFTYVLRIQKQPGANDDQFNWTLHFPSNFVPLNVNGYDAKNHLLTLSSKVEGDLEYKIKFQKK